MGDLVLRTRVNITRRNLQRIAEFRKVVDRYETSLNEFLSLPETIAVEIDELWQRVHGLEPEVRRLHMANEASRAAGSSGEADFSDSTEKEQRDKGPHTELKNIADSLDKLARTLVSPRKKAGMIREQARQLMVPRRDVENYLIGKADEDQQVMNTENYLEKRAEADALFSDYVELVRGLALRLATFGDDANQLRDLFLIADELPGLWPAKDWMWRSLAVPSRQEHKPGAASLLRIGFPEWTVWALPFAHHAFAHIFIERQTKFDPRMATADADILADALATVVSGPAYACAALLLRLDPAAVTDPLSEAAIRSATVLCAIRRILQRAPETPVQFLVDRLHGEWCDAVKAARGKVEAFTTALAYDSITRAVDLALDLYLGSTAPAWLNDWPTVSTWATQLKHGDSARIDLSAVSNNRGEYPIALNLMLNAIWLARVGVSESEDMPDEKLDAAAKGAVSNMLRVITPGSRAADNNSSSTRANR